MRANQIDLQLANLIAGDAHVAQLSDSGSDGVRDFIARNNLVDHGTGQLNRRAGIGSEEHSSAFPGDLAHVLQREIVSVDVECVQQLFLCAGSE